MRFRITVGPLRLTWRATHHPAVCDQLVDWLVSRALAAEEAHDAERAAHLHLARCGDTDCGLYQLLADNAAETASALLDPEMEGALDG